METDESEKTEKLFEVIDKHFKRRSDKILLYIYEELYVKTPEEVYPV